MLKSFENQSEKPLALVDFNFQPQTKHSGPNKQEGHASKWANFTNETTHETVIIQRVEHLDVFI